MIAMHESQFESNLMVLLTWNKRKYGAKKEPQQQQQQQNEFTNEKK